MDKEERRARKRERKKDKMIANARKDRARKAAGKPGGILVFLKTFLIAFCIFFIIATPIFALVGKVADINPFMEDSPVLAEELDVLVSEDSPFFQAFTESDRANILLMGVNGGLTDTIMLVSFDRENNRVDIISVPRDTYYHRAGYNSEAENKINAAYRKDPVNTAKAVSEVLLGIPINYYAVIEYEGVKNVVNAMGGVPMTIPNLKGKGGMYYKDPYDKPPLVIALPAGEQVLNGDQAVQFLRFRHDYAAGDIGRVEAQQEFVKSAIKQCLSLNLPKIAKTAFNNVTSDITIGTALGLAANAIGMDSANVKTYMLPAKYDPDPPYYVFPDSEGIADMITQIYSPPAAATGSAVSTGGKTE